MTGEEEEDTVYQVRGKLFALSSQNQWKERGTGMLRLNVRRADGGGARLGAYSHFGSIDPDIDEVWCCGQSCAKKLYMLFF